MTDKIKMHQRSKEILQLLKKHGPLSYRSLMKMMSPPITRRRLLEAVQRLRKRKFVDRRFERLWGGRAVYYNLCQQEESLRELAEYLEVSADELRQPHFRYRELLHSECCALWTHILLDMFPEAKVVRDFEFKHNKAAEKIMLTDNLSQDVDPDLLLIFPQANTHEEISIAVEVERSPKTIKRLKRKLQKYATGTHVDGVIYLCETEGIRDSISGVYNSKSIKNSKRVGHYSDNFLLFGDAQAIHTESFLDMLNSRFETVFLPRWVTYLRETRLNARRDKNFGNTSTQGLVLETAN